MNTSWSHHNTVHILYMYTFSYTTPHWDGLQNHEILLLTKTYVYTYINNRNKDKHIQTHHDHITTQITYCTGSVTLHFTETDRRIQNKLWEAAMWKSVHPCNHSTPGKASHSAGWSSSCWSFPSSPQTEVWGTTKGKAVASWNSSMKSR